MEAKVKDNGREKVPVVRHHRIEMRYVEDLGILSPRRVESSEGRDDTWIDWDFDEDNPTLSDLSSSMAYFDKSFDSNESSMSCQSCGSPLGLSHSACPHCGSLFDEKKYTVTTPLISNDEIVLIRPPIGSGAFSVVFRGKCRGKDVAVKVLKIEMNSLNNLTLIKSAAPEGEGLQADKRVHRILASEVGVLSRLSHPNIISFLGTCFDLDLGKPLDVISEDGEEEASQAQIGGIAAAIVMEYCPRGDLRTVLQNQMLPLYLRLQFAIDIAEAMAWLTGPNLQTLHRDLKPQNVLVDENWNCKVADFGLSQLTKLRDQIRDKGRSPGTALYSAPEVLLHKPVDKKLDVYSFALVLWEILTCKSVFPDHNDYDEFVQKVAVKGERPSTKGIPSNFASILSRCWAANPADRPDFHEIIGLLVQSRLELYLPEALCPLAAIFWTTFAHNAGQVSLLRFMSALNEYLHVPEDQRDILKKCIPELMLDKEDVRTETVSLEFFSTILKWFGPMAPHRRFPHILTPLSERIILIMSQTWFFGPIGSPKATTYLQSYANAPGTFLVRLNPGGHESIETAPVTISRVNGDRTITHVRIRPYRTEGYRLRFESGKGAPAKIKRKTSLLELIEFLMENHRDLCGRVCPAYPYRRIFASPLTASNGYGAYVERDASSSDDSDETDATTPAAKRFH